MIDRPSHSVPEIARTIAELVAQIVRSVVQLVLQVLMLVLAILRSRRRPGHRDLSGHLLGLAAPREGTPLHRCVSTPGHVSPQITVSIYAHALNEHGAEAAELIRRAISTG